MSTNKQIMLCLAAACSLLWTDNSLAASAKDAEQETVSLPVHVVDPDGKPVAGATVAPWALRCSQGHGLWQPDGFGRSKPPQYTTDVAGNCEVKYPRFAILDERVQTTEVTLSIDHPEFAYTSYEGVNVPRSDTGPHTAKLNRGATIEIVPVQNGKPAPLKGISALWSDARSYEPGVSLSTTSGGALRLPVMPAGHGQVLLTKLDGGHATHFSSVIDLDLKVGETLRKEIELRPAARITGKISDNVPRPIKNGRLSARSLPKERYKEDVNWHSWTPIAEDGTFVIDAWPTSEPIQIIALSTGYIATSGEQPDVVKEKKSADPDWLFRPQVFSAEAFRTPIVLAMTPTVRCDVATVDPKGAPIAGVKIGASPNVGWWQDGTQLYCSPLVRGERLLAVRDYRAAVDKMGPPPFRAISDAKGRAQLELPPGSEDLDAEHDHFELPVTRGRREHRIQLAASKSAEVRLVMQPKGNEHLGEWDKLAGVLFGCTGEQCRRLLNDPTFKAKITKVRERLDGAKNPNDPAVLLVAYTEIAEAFDQLGDKEEAVKWRHKAMLETNKLTAGSALQP
jgi:hypothetical protein